MPMEKRKTRYRPPLKKRLSPLSHRVLLPRNYPPLSRLLRKARLRDSRTTRRSPRKRGKRKSASPRNPKRKVRSLSTRRRRPPLRLPNPPLPKKISLKQPLLSKPPSSSNSPKRMRRQRSS